jgi:hypothetical protein
MNNIGALDDLRRNLIEQTTVREFIAKVAVPMCRVILTGALSSTDTTRNHDRRTTQSCVSKEPVL